MSCFDLLIRIILNDVEYYFIVTQVLSQNWGIMENYLSMELRSE